jgi:hypothetical protein
MDYQAAFMVAAQMAHWIWVVIQRCFWFHFAMIFGRLTIPDLNVDGVGLFTVCGVVLDGICHPGPTNSQ